MNSTANVTARVRLMLISLSLAAGGFVADCTRGETSTEAIANSSPRNPPPAQSHDSAYFKTSFQDESQFVVESIVTDIAEMIYFARNHGLPDAKQITVEAREKGGAADAPVYDMTVKIGESSPIQTKLTLSGPIWSEAVYADVTGAIAQSVRLQSPSSAPRNDAAMLDRLTDGLAGTIAREDLQVSTNLQREFTNPAWHEQAAALLGAFALRENAGLFYDIRLPLCRMTAHLALARFLAGTHPPGINGQVADCMLLTLMNNEVAALDQLKNLDTSEKAVLTWARTLRAYASRDFRPLDAATNVPGIEQIAWFWAYSSVNNRGVAWEKVGDAVTRLPDFSRIVAAMGYGVQTGNVMLQSWLPLEGQEVRDIYQAMQSQELKQEDFVASLNRAPERCFDRQAIGAPRVCVIGWGLWALQLQHHFCHAVATDFKSLQYKLGVPDDAAEFAARCEKDIGGLRFYAFVRRLDCTNKATYRKSTDEGWAFAAEYPHLTPVAWMDYLCGTVSFAPRYRPIPNPHCNEWTVHNPLPGTAYDADARLNFPSFTGSGGYQGRQKALKVHAMAPYDIEICKYIGRTYSTNWTYAAAMSTFGLLLPYSATAAACVADSLADDPGRYEKTMEQAVEWDPSFFSTLADYEWNHGQTNEAIKVYERAADKNPDAIDVASFAARRIKYYLATGQNEKARETADFAGEVYSCSGLAAKAGYFEQTGDLTQALGWYNKIDERYRQPDEALLFCCRHAGPTGDAQLDKQIASRLQAWFDHQEKATLADFTSPPNDGVTLTETSETLKKANLKKGDIVVAARGIRIHNIFQLTVARDMNPAPDLAVIVWQDGAYRETNVTLSASHRFGVLVVNYKR
jgi:tetratricopeptide (TPR) repeat protein